MNVSGPEPLIISALNTHWLLAAASNAHKDPPSPSIPSLSYSHSRAHKGKTATMQQIWKLYLFLHTQTQQRQTNFVFFKKTKPSLQPPRTRCSSTFRVKTTFKERGIISNNVIYLSGNIRSSGFHFLLPSHEYGDKPRIIYSVS